MPRLVLLSDTHGYHDQLVVPDGDVLIHAGDLTQRGRLEEVEAFDEWLARLPHRHKLVIAGNHDFCFERAPVEARARLESAIYLQDAAVELDGVRYYGSPWQPWFMDWAFNLRRGEALAAKWALIPEGTDVLVTHGPPARIGDRTWSGHNAGCEDLTARIAAVRPRLHVYGHIHEARGVRERDGVVYVNASTDEGEKPPIVWELG